MHCSAFTTIECVAPFPGLPPPTRSFSVLEDVPTAASCSMNNGPTSHSGFLSLDVGLLNNAQRLRAREFIPQHPILADRHSILNTQKMYGGPKLVYPFTTW